MAYNRRIHLFFGGKMARTIVVTSGKGGVGKSTVVANLGIKLADMGERVVLVDFDFGLNNLSVVLNVKETPPFDISDVANHRCRVRQALVKIKGKPNLYLMTSDSKNCNCSITGQSLRAIINNLADFFDYVLIDCPAGIDVGFCRAVSVADEIIIVTNPHPSSIKDGKTVVELLESFNPLGVYLVVNRSRGDLKVCGSVVDELQIAKQLGVKLIGVLPEESDGFLNDNISQATKKAYKMLADNVVTGKNNIYNTAVKYSGLIGGLRRLIKKI